MTTTPKPGLTGVQIRLTCWMCPEQYDLTDEAGARLAYFRLRGGYFYASVPDVGGEVVHETSWEDTSDKYKGCFDDDDERRREMAPALAAALAWHGLEVADLSELVERAVTAWNGGPGSYED